jgi:hypothetical protein
MTIRPSPDPGRTSFAGLKATEPQHFVNDDFRGGVISKLSASRSVRKVAQPIANKKGTPHLLNPT